MPATKAKGNPSTLAPALVKSSVATQQVRVPAPAASPKAVPRTVLIEPCPECGETDFADNAVRGRHRRAKHGVLGTSPTAKQRQRLNEETQYSSSEGQLHDTTQRPKFGARPQSEVEAPNPDFAIGYAAGYIASIIDIYSRQAQIPQTEFAQAVFRIISSSESR